MTIPRRRVSDQGLAALADRVSAVELRQQDAEVRHKANSDKIDAALSIHAANAQQIANQTKLLLAIQEATDRFHTRALPVVERNEALDRGAAMLGRFAEWVEKWGRRVAWIVAVLVAGWIFVAAVVSDWAKALRGFFNHG